MILISIQFNINFNNNIINACFDITDVAITYNKAGATEKKTRKSAIQ